MKRSIQGFLFLAFIFGTSPAVAGDVAAGNQTAGFRPGSFPPVFTIVMTDNEYRPQIAKFRGGYVEWRNTSSTVHTATSDDGGKTFDFAISPGRAAYSPWLTTKGEYPYHCRIHGETGTLVVE